MSVKVEASHGGIPHGKIAAAGIIIALVSLYIAALGHEVLGFDYFAFFFCSCFIFCFKSFHYALNNATSYIKNKQNNK